MQKHKQSTLFYLLVSSLVAVFILSACVPSTEGQENAPQTVNTFTMNPTGTLTSGEVSQVTGSAELTVLSNGNTKVVMNLSGLEPNAAHMGHIHVGTCDDSGQVVLGLSPVESDANGKGSSTAEVTSDKIPSPAHIAYHQRGPTDPAGVGSFISCGDIK